MITRNWRLLYTALTGILPTPILYPSPRKSRFQIPFTSLPLHAQTLEDPICCFLNLDISFGLDLIGLYHILVGPSATHNKKQRKLWPKTGWMTRCICRGRMTIMDAIHKLE